MKKKLFLLIAAFMAMGQSAFAYDFSAVAPSGQTLYYIIVNGAAQVTYQNSSSPRYSNLTGALTIPSSVTYNGTTYSVTSISYYAFEGCSGLTSVTIPNSVTSIRDYAFGNCSGLVNFVSKAVYPPTASSDAFNGIPPYCTLTVPCGSLAYYSVTEPWETQFPLKEEDCGTEGVDEADGQGVVVYAAEGSIYVDAAQPAEAAVYDMMGRCVATVTTGASTSVPAGVYLVRVGTLPAKKVVVIR